MLAASADTRIAVVENEFGAVGIDGGIIRTPRKVGYHRGRARQRLRLLQRCEVK